jgi:putative flippase GtrA
VAKLTSNAIVAAAIAASIAIIGAFVLRRVLTR